MRITANQGTFMSFSKQKKLTSNIEQRNDPQPSKKPQGLLSRFGSFIMKTWNSLSGKKSGQKEQFPYIVSVPINDENDISYPNFAKNEFNSMFQQRIFNKNLSLFGKKSTVNMKTHETDMIKSVNDEYNEPYLEDEGFYSEVDSPCTNTKKEKEIVERVEYEDIYTLSETNGNETDSGKESASSPETPAKINFPSNFLTNGQEINNTEVPIVNKLNKEEIFITDIATKIDIPTTITDTTKEISAMTEEIPAITSEMTDDIKPVMVSPITTQPITQFTTETPILSIDTSRINNGQSWSQIVRIFTKYRIYLEHHKPRFKTVIMIQIYLIYIKVLLKKFTKESNYFIECALLKFIFMPFIIYGII